MKDKNQLFYQMLAAHTHKMCKEGAERPQRILRCKNAVWRTIRAIAVPLFYLEKLAYNIFRL